VILAQLVASSSTNVGVGRWAQEVVHTNVLLIISPVITANDEGTYGVLVINLAIASSGGNKLSVLASVVGGVKACLPARLVDDTVGDRAEKVAVLRVAGVLDFVSRESGKEE
jgi:hypothetical protein